MADDVRRKSVPSIGKGLHGPQLPHAPAPSLVNVSMPPSRHYGNRTIDLLFHSVAAWAGPRAIGVILSGTLDDGSRGLAATHEAGSITMVLTASPSPTHEMPANAIDFNGPVDLIGSTANIAQGVSRPAGCKLGCLRVGDCDVLGYS
jgi:chemotaxis response regulator CheB